MAKMKYASGTISVAEAATKRGVSQNTVRAAIKSGRLLVVVQGSRRPKIITMLRVSDVDACIFNSRTKKSSDTITENE